MSWLAKIKAHQAMFDALAEQKELVQKMGEVLIWALQNQGRIYIAGNGGSAADAQHFAAELIGRFLTERRALPAVALTTDSSALTAIANDYGYEMVFARQLAGLGNQGDVFMAISTSGCSPNILKAIEIAKEKGVLTLGLTGQNGGKMKEKCDLCLVVPSEVTAHIQEAHIFIIHYFCALIDEKFQ